MAAFSRESMIGYVLFAKTGVVWLMNKFHEYLQKRVISQMIAAGHSAKQSEVPIPEYDWKNGTPQEFYDTFVVRPHPVILRGFMKDTQLLKDLSWDNVLKNYGEEEQDLDYSVVPESTGGCLVFEGEVKYGPSSYVHGNRNPLGRIHQVTCDDILFQ